MIYLMINMLCYTYVMHYVIWNNCECYTTNDYGAYGIPICDSVWDMIYEGSNGIPNHDYWPIFSWEPYERALWLLCGGRFSGPTLHKGGRVLDVRGIRLEEEGRWLTGETKLILYHSTILYLVYVIMIMLPYLDSDLLHDLWHVLWLEIWMTDV